MRYDVAQWPSGACAPPVVCRTADFCSISSEDHELMQLKTVLESSPRARMKEYAQAEGVLARFGVDLESASDLSCRIEVSETAECWEKVQRTSTRPHVDLVPGGNGAGTCLTRADT